MNKDSMALLKFAVAIRSVPALVVVWFATVGAPGGDEEEEIVTVLSGISGSVL